MTTAQTPPFSARNRHEKKWIENDFPDTARLGLLHLLYAGIENEYLPGWITVAKELRRIARVQPKSYLGSSYSSTVEVAEADAASYLNQLSWEHVYDFCERLCSDLAQSRNFERADGEEITFTKAESQSHLLREMQRLFDEEGLAYEFRDGAVQRRGKRHTVSQISKAENALADQRLDPARRHFSKAVRHFRDRADPDLENAVKEAVCAVEAAAKELYPDAKAATLSDFVKWATGKGSLLPKTIGDTFGGLYAFRNSGEGVSHGATSGGAVTIELAEYVLGTAASQIVLLTDLLRAEEEPPF